MNKIILFLIFFSIVFLAFIKKNENALIDEIDVDNLPIELIVQNISGKKYAHSIAKLDMTKAEMGRQLILNGKAKKGKLISIHFKCIDCHNLVKETKEPNDLSPESRLHYAKENNLNFLPASTLWGIYNRKSWYNDDYIKKYGDLIKNAKDSLQNAVQVCAKYCSSGRFLENWEVEAIMHYFKQNELKVKDLSLSAIDKKNILFWQKLDVDEKKELLNNIESAYTIAFPATFLPTMPRENRKYGEGASAENGKELFKRSCLSCHENKRVTYLNLIPDKLSAKYLLKNLDGYTDKNLYQVIRWGTYQKAGRKQYMPHYTKEKMSDQQIEDLVAYLKQLSKN
jgi:cytochrome c553